MKQQTHKVIFFLNGLFSKNYYDKFGIELLQKNGFDIEVWNFMPFLQPDVYYKIKIPDNISFEGHRRFTSQPEALTAISQLTVKDIVVSFLVYDIQYLSIYRALSKYNVKYAVFSAGAIPFNLQSQKVGRFLDRVKLLTQYENKLQPLLNFLFVRVPYRHLGVKPATFNIAGGEKSVPFYRYPVSAETEILWLHYWDYDFYLDAMQKGIKTDAKTCVFLDEYWPFNYDATLLGLSSPVSADEYYPLMCQFFDYLEDNYGVRTIIAAHPKSRYEEHPDYFGDRSVIRGKTAELVKDAGFVIANCSTSISFPVLFKKPIIFTTTNQLQNSRYSIQIESMSSTLGKKAINLNDGVSIDWENELTVDENAYSNYKNWYIKKDGTPDLPMWQIFANHLKLDHK